MNNELPDEILLQTPKRKTIFRVVASIGFTAIGFWMIKEGNILGWPIALLSGAAILLFEIQLIQGSDYLRIDREGIHIGTIRSADTTYRWGDISDFSVVSFYGNTMVALKFSNSYKKEKVARLINSNLLGYDGVIPSTYGLKPEELAVLLTDYKQNKEVAPENRTAV